MRTMINGIPGAEIDSRDRGFHYGDGLFETLAVIEGRPCLWQAHMQRLTEGCRRLGLPAPDHELLRREALSLCQGEERAVLKIIISRGSGGRGYRQPDPILPTRFLALYPWPDYPSRYAEEGVVLWRCQTSVSIQPRLAGVKHLNRLDNVLARQEWEDEAAEGLMEDGHGHLVEGTMSNLFFVNESGLHTPELSRCGVAGILREQVLQWAQAQGITCHIADYTYDDLKIASEVFVCNSLIGLWPVRQIGEHSFVGRGRICQQLQQRNHQFDE